MTKEVIVKEKRTVVKTDSLVTAILDIREMQELIGDGQMTSLGDVQKHLKTILENIEAGIITEKQVITKVNPKEALNGIKGIKNKFKKSKEEIES